MNKETLAKLLLICGIDTDRVMKFAGVTREWVFGIYEQGGRIEV